MKTLKFNTNINCGGCVAAIKPHLDAEPSIETWSVDTSRPQKTLTVSGDSLNSEKIREVVKNAGFRIEPHQ